MEKSVHDLLTEYKFKKKNLSSKENKTSSERNKFNPEIQKEVNSWDCSTPSENEKTPQEILNDWDASSDLQETIVEAFDLNSKNLTNDDWDFESEKISPNTKTNKESPLFVASSLDSFCLSNASYIGKKTPEGREKKEKNLEDGLLVEDLDDYLKDNSVETPVNVKNLHIELPTTPDSEKVRSKQSEGTPEDTIWMIPKSERSESGDSTSKLISSSDRENIENQNGFRGFFKKTKSLSDMQKRNVRRRTARSSRSEHLDSKKNNYNTFLLCEGSNQQRKLEIDSKDSKENILCREKFHRTRVFFTESECKAMTIDKKVPEKLSPSDPESIGNTNEDVLLKENVVSGQLSITERSETGAENNNGRQPGFSGAFLDENTPAAFDGVECNSCVKIQNEDSHSMGMDIKDCQPIESTSETRIKPEIKESWLLFDEAGKYQQISKTEVSMMFNGRSADAVLQGRAEHFIPTSTFADSKSLKNVICNIDSKESVQNILTEEDPGGDDEFKRLIDLERKVENTLFYIRPETDFRASIRIIPVNAEMIHLWKRNRDSGTSNISFDADVMSVAHGLIETDLRPSDNTDFNSTTNYRLPPENEKLLSATNKMNQMSDKVVSDSQSADFSKLLTETREVVETLSSNFKLLQTRLDGESSRSLALQGELSKLRTLLKTYPEASTVRNSDIQTCQMGPCTNASLLTLKASDKVDMRSESIIEEETEELLNAEMKERCSSNRSSIYTKLEEEAAPTASAEQDNAEDSNVITVNIYTVDPPSPGPSSSNNQEFYIQSTMKVMEKKLKRLQQENITITRQNLELKRKLKEISLELEKYLTNTQEPDSNTEDAKEVEVLREQVAYLRQEMESMKTIAKDQEEILTEENSLIREELTKTFTSLNDWHFMAGEIFRKIQSANKKMEEIGLAADVNLEMGLIYKPKDFGNIISCYLEEATRNLCLIKHENHTLRDMRTNSNEANEFSSLDQVISNYSELIEECRKSQATSDPKDKLVDDYFAIIMEKTSLMEEIKILKTENEILVQSQMEHYEKLKQTMIALKDQQSEIIALESSQKLSEDEKIKLTEVLRLYEVERTQLETELLEKGKLMQNLQEELKDKELKIQQCTKKLTAAENEINGFEKSYNMKDEVIRKLKIQNEDLSTADEMKNHQIEIFKNEIQNLEMQNNHLEAELTSAKIFLENSQKEMADYIAQLEGLVSSSQDSLEKTKQKLKEANQTIIKLKNECDVLEKQHQCDVKLFNNTKDELELCKEKLQRVSDKLKQSENEQEKWKKKYEFLADSDKEKLEALESLTKEYKITIGENDELRDKVNTYSRDKEELLSEQKELIGKYGLLSKEIQKLQEKYHSVKAECNERTDLIRYLETMLKENFVEYNNRIAGLENNITQIVEKILAYKNELKGKYAGEDPEVKELRHQLNITCQERKGLESVVDNYYSLMRRLEKEIEDREKKVDELHMKLSLEQQKAADFEKLKSLRIEERSKTADISKIKKLENQIAAAENELGECRRELQRCQTNHENEKKKLQLTIANLRSEVKRYQLRTEVMLKNLSNCNKNMDVVMGDKRNGEDDGYQPKKELEEKDKIILELNEMLEKYKAEIKLKDDDLENFKKKNYYQNEELKNLQNRVAKLLETVTSNNKTSESQQKERDEMAEKLFQSIKLIMEERSTRQTIESLALEKERNYKNQIEDIKNELVLKVKECETLTVRLQEKEKLVRKLQNSLMKMKVDLATLKMQLNKNKKRNNYTNKNIKKETNLLLKPTPTQTKLSAQERLESCLSELKEIRSANLELRKAEGQYQAKIVRLEDEIRDARLLIKELQGDIKTEKKSKKAFKNMICAAKMEVEKCVMSNQLVSAIAERINRHLDLSEISSRELLSGFRLSESTFICT